LPIIFYIHEIEKPLFMKYTTNEGSMKSRTVWIAAGALLLIVVLLFTKRTKNETIRVNNQTCPVTGHPVNDTDTYTHNGKEYRLCNEKCKQTLSENPDQYLSE